MTIKTRKFNVQFEVLEDVTDGQLHEDLCLTLHEGQATDMKYVVDIGLPEMEPTFPVHVDIAEWDNRDTAETWLWIDKVRYVSVNPFDMIENMVENCLPWITDNEGVTAEELEDALKILKRASGR